MPKYDLVINDFLKQEGLTLVGGDALSPLVVDEEGKEYTLDTKAMLEADGMDLKEIDLKLNDPKDALPISPLSIKDRAALSFGNTKGSLNYLKNKFDDAKFDADSGLVVNKNGAWYQVDPTLVSKGDPWEMAKELAKDTADWFGDAPVIAGGAAGSIGGLGLASIPVASVGAATGETIRTALGMIIGSYDATPEEQAKDIALEGAFGLMGQAVGLGVKPTINTLKKGLGYIAEKASPPVKQAYSFLFGNSTGVGAKAMEVAIDQNAVLSKKLNAFSKQYASSMDLDAALDPIIRNKSELFLEEATEALSSKYGQILDTMFERAETSGLSVDVSKIVDNSIRSIEQAGLGKIVDKKGKLVLEAFSPEEVANKTIQGQAVENLTPNDLKAVNDVIRSLNAYSKIGTVKGKVAASALANINKNLNRTFKRFQREPQLSRVGAIATQNYRNSISEVFKEAGLDLQWAEASNLYARYSNSVGAARRALNSQDGVKIFSDRLLADSAAGRRAQGMASDLIQLIGPKGEEMFNDIVTDEAARRFSTILPNMGLWAKGASTPIAAGAAFSTLNPATAAATLATTSPKAVFKTTGYALKGLDFIKGLTDTQRKTLLQNPAAFRGLIQIMGNAQQEEDEATAQLLKEGGL